jgi:pyrroloquinoline quinone biosynthesis protein D
MVKLNASAGEIMTRIDGVTSVIELVRALELKFNTTGLHADVLDFLTIAQGRGWIKL